GNTRSVPAANPLAPCRRCTHGVRVRQGVAEHQPNIHNANRRGRSSRVLLQIPARESTGRVAVDVREPLCRSPHAHERLDLFWCAGLAYHLDPPVSLSERGDEAHAVACGRLWELGYVLAAHVYDEQRIAHRVARIRTNRRIRSAGLPTRARDRKSGV